MFDKANSTLNSKDEYFNVCPHKREYLLWKGWIKVAQLSLSLSSEIYPYKNPILIIHN